MSAKNYRCCVYNFTSVQGEMQVAFQTQKKITCQANDSVYSRYMYQNKEDYKIITVKWYGHTVVQAQPKNKVN